MADFTALKGCRFGGTVYKAGEIIPEAAVNPKRVRQLIALGIIRAVVAVQQEPEPPKEPPQEATAAEETTKDTPVSAQEPPQEAKATKDKEEPAKGKKTTQKAG